MKYVARILNREGQPVVEAWRCLVPVSMSWTAEGGCDEALLRLEGAMPEIGHWMGYLGFGVEIHDELGRMLWWGWLEGVKQTLPAVNVETSLAGMANRIAVAYQSQEPGNAFGELRQTAWAENIESQTCYGIKERLVRAGSMSEEQARLQRDILLGRSAMLAIKVAPRSPEGSKALYLRCRGWIHRLNWRVWQRESGVVGNTPTQNGVQAVGDSLERSQIGQSFLVHRNTQLSAVQLRLRKQGTPTDSLRVDIRADAAGSPDTSNLASCMIDPSQLERESYPWVTAAFLAQISLHQGTRYWIVLSRSGAWSSSDYYLMGLDVNLQYTDGQMKLFRPGDQSWVARVPPADALFKLVCLSRWEDELNAMLMLGSDVLRGSKLETASGLRLPAAAVTGVPLLKAIRGLLSLGTSDQKRYLMDLSPERFLRIYAEPGEDELSYSMDGDGVVYDKLGREVLEKSLLVAKRVRTLQGDSFLVSKVRLKPEREGYEIEAF